MKLNADAGGVGVGAKRSERAIGAPDLEMAKESIDRKATPSLVDIIEAQSDELKGAPLSDFATAVRVEDGAIHSEAGA
jgi:hypothetical protein